MGHTIPPFTWQYQNEKAYFSRFRRALLLAGDKDIFDDLWNTAEFHISAAEKTSHPLPIATVMMMMTLEQQKTIELLKQRTEMQADQIIQLEKALYFRASQVERLAQGLGEIEKNVNAMLQDFRDEMLAIKYPEYEFAP